VRLEDVDEAGERRAVVQFQPDDVERHADQAAREQRLTVRAVDLLADADQRRQEAAAAPDVPDSVELGHDL
jgi:hypothetical protein